MRKIDHLGLDGNTLQTFLTVLEEASVSKAAVRLGVSQSAVSHTLDKLRLAFDDSLFVRDGRGIIPTAKAQKLHDPIKSILDNLKSLSYPKTFDPLFDPVEFTIAANDVQLTLIFPKLLKELYAEGINPRFNFIASGVPNANLKRASRCQLLITPAPPNEKDIIKERLFQSEIVCFYDAAVRKPPKTWKQFVASKYADVKFSDTESSIMILPSIRTTALNAPTVSVANFSALQTFIKGTDLITTQLSFMSKSSLIDLDSAPLPFKTSPLSLYLVWHRRDQDDAALTWLRQRIQRIVDSIVTD